MARTRFHSLLIARLEEVIVDRTQELTYGQMKNYEDYKYSVGYLMGLRDVLKICDEVNADEFGAPPQVNPGDS